MGQKQQKSMAVLEEKGKERFQKNGHLPMKRYDYITYRECRPHVTNQMQFIRVLNDIGRLYERSDWYHSMFKHGKPKRMKKINL